MPSTFRHSEKRRCVGLQGQELVLVEGYAQSLNRSCECCGVTEISHMRAAAWMSLRRLHHCCLR